MRILVLPSCPASSLRNTKPEQIKKMGYNWILLFKSTKNAELEYKPTRLEASVQV